VKTSLLTSLLKFILEFEVSQTAQCSEMISLPKMKRNSNSKFYAV